MIGPAGYEDDDESIDPREDLGYRGSREAEPDDLDDREAPAAPEERPLPPIAVFKSPPAMSGVRGSCRFCPAKDVMLFQTPGRMERTACAACQGRMFRDHTERTRECVRALKAAAARGDAGEERVLIAQLRGIVGTHQADETVNAIRAASERASAGAQGARRGGGGY